MRNMPTLLFILSAIMILAALASYALPKTPSPIPTYHTINQVIQQFGRSVYLHQVMIGPNQEFVFPKGSHLYMMRAKNREGGLSWIHAEGGTGYHIAMDAHFYVSQREMLSGEVIPVLFGDRYFQNTIAGHPVTKAISVKNFKAMLTFFTLAPLSNQAGEIKQHQGQ